MTRILVIDSDNDIAEILRLSLQPELYDIMVAQTNDQALECARTAKPTVVLLDLASDNYGSQHLCKTIRELTPAPILVLSPINTPAFMTDLLNEGADDCLVKPATNSVLVARLKTLIRRAQAEMEATDYPLRPPAPYSSGKNGSKPKA